MSDIVVKSNKLVQAFQTLSLSEVRLLQLAIIDARETGKGITPEHPLELHACRYAQAFELSTDTAYLALIEAEESLFKRQFTITNDDGTLTKSRWIQDANYKRGEGKVLVTLTRVVIEHVTRIDGFEQYFTSYRLQKTAKFKSVYAVRLYELLIQWKSVRKTPVFEINKFRNQLGIGVNEYNRMEAFKRRVLEVAVEQINEFSDVIVEYEQHKKGRSISGFQFTFKQKKSHHFQEIDAPSLSDLHRKMTEAQRHLFAKKLSELPEMNSYSQGTESYEQFAMRIADMLKIEKKFEELYPYLAKVGYSASNKPNK